MDNDILSYYIDIVLQCIGINIKRKYIFTFLYNFIPAFIFAPFLIYKGYEYHDNTLIIIGVLLFIVDTMHFVGAISNNTDEYFEEIL